MDNVHGDERNLPRSADGRSVHSVTDDQQITKLKEEHQKEIQNLTYKSKIELMESQMKIVNLTHQPKVKKFPWTGNKTSSSWSRASNSASKQIDWNGETTCNERQRNISQRKWMEIENEGFGK